MLKQFSKFGPQLAHIPVRQFSLVAPTGKLHFIDHPRYGSVYPLVSINDRNIYFRLIKFACFGTSTLNFSIVYSLFVNPIFVPAITSVICNPLFIVPSLLVNYALFSRYYILFFNRSFVTNMFLKPNGKQVIVETFDGESKVINNKDFYKVDIVQSRMAQRIDMYYGANNYLYIFGNSFAFDSSILGAATGTHFIDIRNVAYDYDVTKEFAWDFKELVEIKKRKRRVSKFFRPTLSVLQKLQSVEKFQTNKKVGALKQSRQILKPFDVFTFQADRYLTKEEKQKQIEKNDIYLNYAGSKQLKEFELRKSVKETSGRKVKSIIRSKSVQNTKK